MNEHDKTLAELNANKVRIPINQLILGDNYKNVTEESIKKLKESMIEEIKRGQDPQVVPILMDIRAGKFGTIIGGYHQYFAIKDIIDNGYTDKDGTMYTWPFKDEAWIEPKSPVDDKHAKVLALKHNAQYDLPTTERLAEWGAELVDSEYKLIDVPVVTDYREITMLDVMDKVGPSEELNETKEDNGTAEPKTVKCPSCGFEGVKKEFK